MLVLGFDSTAPTLSVGIADGDHALGRWDATPDRHRGDALDLLIDQALAEVGLQRTDVRGLALVTGPGSLTAMRIGWATACGWALASGIPITGWTVAEVQWRKWMQPDPRATAFAQSVASSAAVFCLVHHRGQEFYRYQFTPDGPPSRPDKVTLGEWHPSSGSSAALLGPGLLSFRDRWGSCLGPDVAMVPESEALVGGDLLALWGSLDLTAGRHLTLAVSPLDYGLPPDFRKAK